MPIIVERLLAGVDEAGRGPLAGPVVAAAVILDPRRPIRGLADSKQLDPETREVLAVRIRERALCWAVGWSEPEEIDAHNILEATHLAMRRAVLGLAVPPRCILVDGNRLPCIADLLPMPRYVFHFWPGRRRPTRRHRYRYAGITPATRREDRLRCP